MHRNFIITASLLAAAAVALGAFGAHALKEILTPQQLNTFDTAVRYQFYNVFALALTAIVYKEYPSKPVRYAGTLFIAGIILFSGSLYLLTWLTATGHDNFKWLGAITPLGGLLFIAGWLSLGFGVMRKKL